MQSALFTIGHSNHKTEFFLQLLDNNAIQVVVDVRSAPYSRYVPVYNKSELERTIKRHGLRYIFMGDLIGGKPTDPQFLDSKGKVRYDKLAETTKFKKGIDRLLKGLADGWRIVLMCAEEDPGKCHRQQLIAKELETIWNIPVMHLRADGSTIRAQEIFYKNTQPEQLKIF